MDFLPSLLSRSIFQAAGAVVIALPSTKTSGRRMAQESVVTYDRTLLRLLCCHLPRSGPIFLGFLQCFIATSISWLLTYTIPRMFSGYSFRRGGATSLYILSGSLAKVMSVGRWASERTARIYLDDARASLAQLQESYSCQQTVDRARAALPKLLCRASRLGGSVQLGHVV